ncbi:MAG: RNA 2',3'-cyclic phosphodiesterase [Anaerolineales bacterium]|nr:RNA 2',3'-cyclic phosphodiesterase [Anaerolineae bacterium]PWB75798.1 MAG: RNA 2',3'-cyclic phosphodiesterase [Anaerolineales bacterium]
MSLIRTFIAVDIPPRLQAVIQEHTDRLRKSIGTSLVRWVPSQNIHLTLKFLGDVSPANIDILTQMLRTEADSCPAFDIRLSGLGSFPSLKRPRVIYIGIQAPAELEAFQHGIESAAAKLGYESESRGFSPHLTVGRVRQEISASDLQKIRQALEELQVDSLGTARVDSVKLYKSDLKPGGAVYTQLFSAPLQTQ